MRGPLIGLALFLSAFIDGRMTAAQTDGSPRVGATPPPSLSPQQVATLTRSLFSDDSFERTTAVIELIKHPADAAGALPSLKRAFDRESDPRTKNLMLYAIARIESAGRDEPLIEPKPSDIKRHAASLAGLIPQLSDKQEPPKRQAAGQLRRMGAMGWPALATLRKLAQTERDEVTRGAMKLAAEQISEQTSWFAPTTSERNDSKPLTEEELVALLTKLVEALTAKLSDADKAVRLRAIRQLTAMDAAGQSATAKLQEMALNDADPAVRRAAGAAIRRITAAQAENDAWYEMLAKKQGEPDAEPSEPKRDTPK